MGRTGRQFNARIDPAVSAKSFNVSTKTFDHVKLQTATALNFGKSQLPTEQQKERHKSPRMKPILESNRHDTSAGRQRVKQ